MTKFEKEVIRTRTEVLKAMDEAVRSMNDENSFDFWIMAVPDEATTEDFEEIAKDTDEYKEIVQTYMDILTNYAKYDL